MSIETAWFVPAPAIETVWIGPAGEAEAREAQTRERDPIPVIIGPRGGQGPEFDIFALPLAP